jgi:uroporphyrinogen decarboxylase
VNPRENILAAMKRKNPDRVPFGLSFTAPMYDLFRKKTGAENPAEYWDFDARGTYFRSPSEIIDYGQYFPKELPKGTFVDDWGVANVPGSMYHFTKMLHPLRDAKSVCEIKDFPLPDYRKIECWETIESEVISTHERGYAVVGALEMTIFEVSWYIRGMENLMSDMMVNPPMAAMLFDRVTDLRIFQARTFSKFGVDILALGDDISMQTGMLMSPIMWRKWFKPRLAEVIQAAKKIKPDLLVQYHTDGDCRDVIPDLIDVGVDILNPIQPECMDPLEIKSKYGDQLSFSGTIGTQSTMPYGSPDDVKNTVKKMIETVGKGGGLFLSPTHVIEPDVPWENVISFVETAKYFGKYRY